MEGPEFPHSSPSSGDKKEEGTKWKKNLSDAENQIILFKWRKKTWEVKKRQIMKKS